MENLADITRTSGFLAGPGCGGGLHRPARRGDHPGRSATSAPAHRDVLAWIVATLLVALIPLFGLIVYLMLRPRETLAETYERSLEQEALLQAIEEPETCPGCGYAGEIGLHPTLPNLPCSPQATLPIVPTPPSTPLGHLCRYCGVNVVPQVVEPWSDVPAGRCADS